MSDEADEKDTGELVGAIDAGTSTVSFCFYTVPNFKEIARCDSKLNMISPQDGWFEQDPMEILNAIYSCSQRASAMLPKLQYRISDVVSIGITNQRETVVVWDARTGQPLYNALVWKDIRSDQIVNEVLKKVCEKDINYFKNIAGLPLSPYFSAPKLRWLLENVDSVRKANQKGYLKAGTVDSWIVWNLTEGYSHITDVTNASRTLLMDINELQWSPELLHAFCIDQKILPKILSSSQIFDIVTAEQCVLSGIRISGIVGNQQASLLGLRCVRPGSAKCSYRSGCFLLCNTGERAVISSHGLLTTVACKLGPFQPALYALEGSVAVGGHALHWLENRLRMIDNHLEAEKYAELVPTTGDVYFVPAFTGLYAPYWRKDARGLIIGITQFTNKNHIVRAALEAICFQTRDILESMNQDSGFELHKLYVDGPMTTNNLLMQLQADTTGVIMFRSQLIDNASLGAALCAAQAEGIDLFKFNTQLVPHLYATYDTFFPTNTEDERKHRYGRWKRAVERSMNWVTEEPTRTRKRSKLLGAIPGALYMIGTCVMMKCASCKK